ncbi:MAG: ribose 5-phosphate isomerase B [Anaerolineales bacterium]|nr:ribose 5-phosphate isomerase B [Anaerolineales bacterium]
MSAVSDDEIGTIVHRVVAQLMGLPPQESTHQTAPESGGQTTQLEPAAAAQQVVAIGADHGGYELKEILKQDVAALGYEVMDVGTHSKEPVDYPDLAHEVARAVGAGRAWRGIMIDGAGIGSCIVANKVPGVRAGLAYDYASAVNSREHNDTNVLTLGAGLIGVNLAKQIVTVWLATPFGGGRHERRVNKILIVEKLYTKWVHLINRD